MHTAQFTAWCHCPCCDRYDCHRMRTPHAVDKWDILQYEAAHAQWEAEGYDHHRIVTFGGATVTDIYTPARPVKPVDESHFDVIRICQCGHEFGQT